MQRYQSRRDRAEDPNQARRSRRTPWLPLGPALAAVLGAVIAVGGCAGPDPTAMTPRSTSPKPAPSRPATPAPERSRDTAPPADTSRSETPMTASPNDRPARPAGSNAEATQRLERATAAGDLAGVRRAIADGAGLEQRNRDGRTPLVVATKANRVEIARALLDAGADPNAKDDLRDSAFLYAGAEGLDAILDLTLEHGADVRSTNRYGGTALIPASEHAHVETVRTLIAAGVPINHINSLGWTALHEAIVLGNGDQDHVTVVRLLLEAGADATIPDRNGVQPRELAQRAGHDAIVAELDRRS